MADEEYPQVRFKEGTRGASLFYEENDKLILVGGAVTTPGIFARFGESLAHLNDDGTILRYGQQIGTRDDLEPRK